MSCHNCHISFYSRFFLLWKTEWKTPNSIVNRNRVWFFCAYNSVNGVFFIGEILRFYFAFKCTLVQLNQSCEMRPNKVLLTYAHNIRFIRMVIAFSIKIKNKMAVWGIKQDTSLVYWTGALVFVPVSHWLLSFALPYKYSFNLKQSQYILYIVNRANLNGHIDFSFAFEGYKGNLCRLVENRCSKMICNSNWKNYNKSALQYSA